MSQLSSALTAELPSRPFCPVIPTLLSLGLSSHFFPSDHVFPPFSTSLPTLSSPNILALPMNNAPTYPPRNRMSPACTAVIRTRFSVSARCAFSCASCAWRCAYWRALFDVEPVDVEREEEGRDSEPVLVACDCMRRDILLLGVQRGMRAKLSPWT